MSSPLCYISFSLLRLRQTLTCTVYVLLFLTQNPHVYYLLPLVSDLYLKKTAINKCAPRLDMLYLAGGAVVLMATMLCYHLSLIIATTFVLQLQPAHQSTWPTATRVAEQGQGHPLLEEAWHLFVTMGIREPAARTARPTAARPRRHLYTPPVQVH